MTNLEFNAINDDLADGILSENFARKTLDIENLIQ